MRSGIGDTLRAARRAQGRTLSDAAEATRVRETYLAALEQGDFGALGGDVYTRGFLRSYARYLELDPEPLVQAYLAEVPGAEPRGRGRGPRRRGAGAERHPADPGPRRGAGGEPAPRLERPPQERPPGAAVLLALVLIVLVVVAFVGLRPGRAGAAAAPGERTVELVEDVAR